MENSDSLGLNLNKLNFPGYKDLHLYSNEEELLGLCIKADFQSAEFSERAEILLFTRENVTLKLNR